MSYACILLGSIRWNPISFGTNQEQQSYPFKGIILVSNKQELIDQKELEKMEGIFTRDISLPDDLKVLEEELEPYLNKPISKETMQKIKQTIYDFYVRNGDPFVLVLIPPQSLDARVLQVVVVPAKIGKITVKGNRWTPASRLIGYLSAKSGDRINLQRLRDSVSFMNRNPFRRVDLLYESGQEKGTTDLTLVVSEKRPYRLYAGGDNTGVETTGSGRFLAGLNVAEMFGLDHIFTFQGTSSTDLKRFRAATFQYTALLPRKNILDFYGGVSSVHTHLPLPAVHSRGKSSQFSFRYIVPLSSSNKMTHQFSLGGDYKNTNNTIELGALFTEFNRNVNLTQMAGEYFLKIENIRWLFECDFQFFCSPGQWLPNQSSRDYSFLRPGATSYWLYGRERARFVYATPKNYSLELLFRAQLSTNALLPSEQMGIGGYDTVRGYDERQLNVDEGILASAEFRFPPMRFFSFFGKSRFDTLQFLGFVDYGLGDNHHAHSLDPIDDREYLLGTGLGLRYAWNPFLSLRLDLGFKLHQKDEFSGGKSTLHFSLIGAY